MKRIGYLVLALPFAALLACSDTADEQKTPVQVKEAGYSKQGDRDAAVKEFTKRLQTVKDNLVQWKGKVSTLAEDVRSEAERMTESLGMRIRDLEKKLADAGAKTEDQWASLKAEIQAALKGVERDAENLKTKFQ